MAYWEIRSATVITVPDHRNLLAAWRTYRDPLKLNLVRCFVCKKPLTENQLRRLPAGLRARL